MTDTRWLDDSQQQAWRAFIRVHAELTVRIARQLQADSDLSLAEFEVLVNLSELPEPRIRVLELAKQLNWEKSRVSHQLGRMQKRGLITRAGCEEDRRGSFIELTDQGRAAIEGAAPGHVAVVRRLMFDALAPDQVRALTALCDQVLTNIETANCPKE
ncbi:MarR family winged helix-turn-helix transcriptional regulator [Crossiella cryophila]|uniref:DNA-binding MarR family transcriptional regulator n=1 Tax=Crossiella cryophila TaxID=43355 RepID=A0A7W7CHK5_9PSEU|nr:MarR family transcriptional regulator [Crossiella cryophila]MBB4681311.1 DNA-binding MarR family transcriptional regulator [Crossiella cryophila]